MPYALGLRWIWALSALDPGGEAAPPRSANSQRKCASGMQTSQPRAQTLNPLPCAGLTRRRHHPSVLKDHPGARDQLAREQLDTAQSPRSLPGSPTSADSKPAHRARLCPSPGREWKPLATPMKVPGHPLPSPRSLLPPDPLGTAHPQQRPPTRLAASANLNSNKSSV